MIRTMNYAFGQKPLLIILLIVNALGTIYGYIWYGSQLAVTPTIFLPFVPDSPTASLFFVFVLIAFLMRVNVPLIEALAAVTLIKYGIWAVVMNIGLPLTGTPLHWQNYMLMFSHAGMAIQALIYMPFYRIKLSHLFVAALWTIHNDIIDYVYMMHPYVGSSLMPYIQEIGYFTFWLSIFSITMVYLFNVRKNSLKFNL